MNRPLLQNASVHRLTDADIAAALASDADSILPTSGFTASVMAAVAEDSAPAPIPFPWRRALPGFFAVAAVFAILLRMAFALFLVLPQEGGSTQTEAPAVHAVLSVVHGAASPEILWSLLALAVSAAVLLFSRRLASSA